MFNPRFTESQTPSLKNEWFNFARQHTLHFWSKNIVYTRVPGCFDYSIRRALFYENGFGEGWPSSIIDINDVQFVCSPKEALLGSERFAMIQHPFERVASIPLSLIDNRDGCATVWLENTGSNWHDQSFLDVIETLLSNKVLRYLSHWWIPQETCMIFRRNHYSKLFKKSQVNDFAWWLGERGIHLDRSLEEDQKTWSPDLDFVASSSDLVHKPLSSFSRDDLHDISVWEKFLTQEVIDKIRVIYEVDFELFEGLA